jgi:hypothetical protein
VQGLALALAANPWALLLTGVAAVGANIYTEYKDMQVGIHGRKARNMRQDVCQVLPVLPPASESTSRALLGRLPWAKSSGTASGGTIMVFCRYGRQKDDVFTSRRPGR